MGKKKGKNQANQDIDQLVSQIEDKTPAPGKKGKKKRKDDDWEADVETELALIGGDASNEKNNENIEKKNPEQEGESETKKGKKKQKRKKNDDDDWENEVQSEIAAMTLDPSHSNKTNIEPSKEKASETNKSAKESSQPNKTVLDEDKIESVTSDLTSETTETSSKKGKKKKGKKEVKEDVRKKPNKAMLKLMKENLRKQQEEQERLDKLEEERIKKEEEIERKRIEALEQERLRKEKKKQDKKDRIKQQKLDGTYLTPAQKELKKRREAYREQLLKQGIELPQKVEGEFKKPKYEKKKKREEKQVDQKLEIKVEDEESVENVAEEVSSPEVKELEHWDKVSSNGNDEPVTPTPVAVVTTPPVAMVTKPLATKSQVSITETPQERMDRRKREFEEKRSTDELRSPVLCVMGHVDTGKTKILDKIRHSNVQDGEAGGITQQIGATNIPLDAIREQTKMVTSVHCDIKVPGLLVIDTPGHESFSNLRSRGSSNCDMAILVVDIMHGLEPQTLESINMLRKNKTPFLVALNKIDRLYGWKGDSKVDVKTTVMSQKKHVKDEFNAKVNGIIVQFAEQSLNVKLYYENDDPKTWISLVPTSAHSGDGMGNLMALVVQLCQTMLAKRLSYSDNLQCTVLEVKAIQGLGTTLDVILTNGRLKYGDTIVVATTDGPVVTHIKALLMPQPLRELRIKSPYDKFNELKAAQGIKILAKDLDGALAGTSLLVAHHEDEIPLLKAEVETEMKQALEGIKLQERGVFVQASTLGSLEALLEFLKQSKIPYSGIGIGPVHKRDVIKASVMLEHDTQWAVILAFDVKIEREAQEVADNMGVTIFSADIIYHLFDAFMNHRENLKKSKQEEFKNIAVFPCQVKILPNCVFKSRDPIVVGVKIESGQLRVGTPLCVLGGEEIVTVGVVTSIESNHKPVDVARTPQEVCIKIEGAPGEAPKMVGRHFNEVDTLSSKISRESINALKEWFRDEMMKSDWQLIIELKKQFEII